MKKINILHTSTCWGQQEMLLSKSLALRDTYGARVLLATLLATKDGAVLCQKASKAVPQTLLQALFMQKACIATQEFLRANFSLEIMASDVYSVYTELLGSRK